MKKSKHWSRIDEEKRLCEMWLHEPLVNPETGLPIERNGPTFNTWKERCRNIGLESRPTATKKMTWRKCQEWRRYPDINPDTGRKISTDGPTYKWIEKQCKLIEEKELVLEGDYHYLPDQKGMVPCVLYRGTWYVLRVHEGRKIWGPLNKPAKGVKLCYYADTWDYHYNHYKPLFIDGPQPKRVIDKRRPPQSSKNDWLGKTFMKTEPKENPKHVVDNIVDLFVTPNGK
jgi:hypothetical protein